MCNVSAIISQLKELNEKVDKEYNDFKNEVSSIDSVLSDLLHVIEAFPSLDVVSGYYLAKKIRDLRKRRREIKNEFEAIQSLRLLLDKNKKELDGIANRLAQKEKEKDSFVYAPRTQEIIEYCKVGLKKAKLESLWENILSRIN